MLYSIYSAGLRLGYKKMVSNNSIEGEINGGGADLPLFGMLLLALFAIIYLNKLSFDSVGGSFFILTMESLVLTSFVGGRTVSLVRIYYLFVLIFLSIVPWIHYTNKIIIWGRSGFSRSDYLVTNSLIFVSSLFVLVTYVAITRKNRVKNFPIRTELKAGGVMSPMLLLIISVSSFIGLFALNRFSISQLLFRGTLNEVRSVTVESSALSLLFDMTARMIPFFCYLYAITQMRGKRWLKVVLFSVMLFSVFPTGVARLMVGFVYIPVILIHFKRLRSSRAISLVLIFSFLFVFPFLEQFRYFKGFEYITFVPDAQFFFEAHFDAYQNFMRAIQTHFVTDGRQLLAVLFFYIPRTFWPNKPVGSGYEMAELQGYEFNNISMPFLGEGYVNFGIVGIFLFAVSLAYFMGIMDRKYTAKLSEGGLLGYSAGVYLFYCGALSFVLRGDLLSSTAFVCAGVVSAFLVRLFCRSFEEKIS